MNVSGLDWRRCVHRSFLPDRSNETASGVVRASAYQASQALRFADERGIESVSARVRPRDLIPGEHFARLLHENASVVQPFRPPVVCVQPYAQVSVFSGWYLELNVNVVCQSQSPFV